MADQLPARDRGGVDWPHFTWSRSMMPADAQPMLVVFLDRDGTVHVSAAAWFLKQLTSVTATIISDSVREYLTHLVRPRG